MHDPNSQSSSRAQKLRHSPQFWTSVFGSRQVNSLPVVATLSQQIRPERQSPSSSQRAPTPPGWTQTPSTQAPEQQASLPPLQQSDPSARPQSPSLGPPWQQTPDAHWPADAHSPPTGIGAAVVVVVVVEDVTVPEQVPGGTQRELVLLQAQQTHPGLQTPGLVRQTTLPQNA